MTKMNKKKGRRRKLSKETEKDTELEKEENTSAESEEVKMLMKKCILQVLQNL